MDVRQVVEVWKLTEMLNQLFRHTQSRKLWDFVKTRQVKNTFGQIMTNLSSSHPTKALQEILEQDSGSIEHGKQKLIVTRSWLVRMLKTYLSYVLQTQKSRWTVTASNEISPGDGTIDANS
ncbi:hypothetical protein T265_05816 [Opisthorchis viverrini]|uniref:Uncharacterized protein n=1 Tax=Opisthorchis viverrini TaxID=6198 RepID=A0A074ZMR0_OPIVI|nr:hypothetical protein T265_05816 [Opisthorchis viverrini]KER27052.1 hypothetical protein T265_05816 [Opisthorchis viverrini]